MNEVTFTVDGPCVPAPRPRVTRKGVYHDQRYEDWKTLIQQEYDVRYGGFESDGPWWLVVTFHGARLNSDGDNCLKGVQDALTGFLWPNDCFKYLQDARAIYMPVVNPRDRRTEIKAGLIDPLVWAKP